MQLRFANPHLLWFLLVLPPGLLAFFVWSWRTRKKLLTEFIQARLLPALTVGISNRRQKIRLAALLMAVVCIILALARPQFGFDWEEVKQRGLDIVVAIDTSKSMLAEDIAPNRLTRAKLAALDLMQQAKSDRLGLVAFAGSAFLQCPLTIDDAAFRQSVEALDVNVIPEGGTALAEAIETATTAFKEGDNHRVLVLFTDGEDHDSGALEAAKKAAANGLRIFTIGIGSAEGELLRFKDAKGRSDYIRDEQGNVVKSHLNETLLQEIAGATQGFYLPLRGAKTIDTLYEKGLAPLPKSESAEKLVKRYHERFHWPLGCAIILLMAEMLFPERKRESKGIAATSGLTPKPQAATSLSTFLFCAFLLVLSVRGLASPSSALREYNAGQYEESLKEYEQLLQRHTDDPRLHFNAGAAAYRGRRFEEATKQFNDALASQDLKLQEQAYYNLGNTLYQLGARDPDPSKRMEIWENSLKGYDSTLKLNPQDTDAKFNYEFVKKKLEELKQQQQRQNKDGKKDQDQQQNDQQQQQQNQDQKKEQEQKQDQQSQQQKQDEKDKQQQQANNRSKEKQEKEQKEKERQQQEQQEKQQQANQSKQKPDQKDQGQPAQGYAAAQMTPEQAQQLLDAQKGDEAILPIKPTEKPKQSNRPIKDW